MKNKKYLILLSLISIPYIYSCNVQNNVTNPNNIDTSNSQSSIISSPTNNIVIPDQPSIFDSNSNDGVLTIKELLGNADLNKKNNDLFDLIVKNGIPIGIKNNSFYSSSYKSILSKFSLSGLNTEYTYTCSGSSLDLRKVLYNDSNKSSDSIIQSNMNILAGHCGSNSGFIGKDGKIYIVSNSKISELKNDDSILDIYEFKAGDNPARLLIDVDKYSNIYFLSKNGIKKINSNGQVSQYKDLDPSINILSMKVDNEGNIYFIDYKLKLNLLDILGKIKTLNFSVTNANLTLDNKNNLYITDPNKNTILKYNPNNSGFELFSGNNIPSINNDNKNSSQIYLDKPSHPIFDENNNAYIFEFDNKIIRKVDANTGISKVILGNSLNQGDGNELSKVFFKNIISIYFKNNSLFVSEQDRIRKIGQNNIVSTIAGNSQSIPSPSSIPLPTAIPTTYNNTFLDGLSVSYPKILYIDKDNSIYISENSKTRVITKDNKISDLNINAESLVKDSKGNIFFASDKLYKMDKNNNVEVFAGKDSKYRYDNYRGVIPDPLFDDPETVRKIIKVGDKANELYLLEPKGIAIDNNDNIYAVVTSTYDLFNHKDKLNSIIRMNPQGIVDKVYSDINKPENLIVDNKNILYFTDKYLHNYFYYNIIKKANNDNTTSLYAGKILNTDQSNPNNSINNLNALDSIFKDNFYINDITVDNNNNIYFSTAENKIYKIN